MTSITQRPWAAFLSFVLLVAALATQGCTPAKVARIETVAAVPDLQVDITTRLERALGLTVRNTGDTFWNLVWDECAYVTPGDRACRILKEPRPFDEPETVQPTSPLPPGTVLATLCWLEGATVPVGRSGTSSDALVHLTFRSGDRQARWTGRLAFAPDDSPRSVVVEVGP